MAISNSFTPTGVYMPPFGMIAGGVLVKALALWYSTSCAAEEQDQNKNIKKKVMLIQIMFVIHPKRVKGYNCECSSFL